MSSSIRDCILNQIMGEMRKILLLILLLFFGTCECAPSVVVTCATGELGKAIAKELSRDHHLIITGRDIGKLQELKNELEHPCELVELDYCNHSSIERFGEFLKSRADSIAGFVLITPRPRFASDLQQQESDWLSLFQETFTGPLEALRSAISWLETEGKIVIIGGTTSVQVMPQYGPACVIRRMWTTYAKALSHELGPKGVSVNVLSPGVVMTSHHVNRITSQADSNGVTFEEQLEQEVQKIPLRRHAESEEVARSVRFLLSSDSNFITGVNLLIDGGETIGY